MAEVFHFVLKLRGLPYSATEGEIVAFLEIAQENVVEVVIPMNDQGRPSGNAFVTCNDQGCAERALEKNKQCMPGSTRYIEIFKSNEGEMNTRNRAAGTPGNWDGVIRLRGLPYRATEQDIAQFLSGYDILKDTIYLCKNENGECAGDAYVQMMNYKSADGCKERNKHELGGRYIEIFNSSNNELRAAMIKAAAGNQTQPAAPEYVPPSTFGGLKMGGGMMKHHRPGPY